MCYAGSMVEFENNDRRSVNRMDGGFSIGSWFAGIKNYILDVMFIRTLKRTENIVSEI